VGNSVFGGVNPMSTEHGVAVSERPADPAAVWVSLGIPGQAFPEKCI